MVTHYDALEWTITAGVLQRTNSFPVSAFHGRPLPLSLEQLIFQLTRNCESREQVVLLAALYVSRMLERNNALPMSSCTVHRLVLVAILVAIKFSCDKFPSNKVMAAAVGISLAELNKLEVKFLCGIGYDLTVSAHDMDTAYSALGIAQSESVVSDSDSEYVVDSGLEEEALCNNYISGETAEWGQQSAISNNYEQHGVATSGGQEDSEGGPSSNNYQSFDQSNKRQKIEPQASTSGESVEASPGWSDATSVVPVPDPTLFPPGKLVEEAMQSSCCIEMSEEEKLGAYVLAATAAE
jgi:hypothetical protein